jgi:hypothetical protein
MLSTVKHKERQASIQLFIHTENKFLCKHLHLHKQTNETSAIQCARIASHSQWHAHGNAAKVRENSVPDTDPYD